MPRGVVYAKPLIIYMLKTYDLELIEHLQIGINIRANQ